MREFLKLEAAAGYLLMLAAMLSLAAANSPFAGAYANLLGTPVSVQFGDLQIAKPLVLWINDGLMAIFFFLVGLEIKREVIRGELSSIDKAALPLFAALGGIIGPALIFAALNWNDPTSLRGWAIPAATDIAFAMGVLALLGTRAPVSLKILLLAIAIIDDLAAILIIALFYTENLSVFALMLASLGAAGLVALNKSRVKTITPYVLLGAFMWVCVLKSGVHATMAGVITALAIPIDGESQDAPSPLETIEHALHPWVAFLILPLFAFANAGVSFSNMSFGDLAAPLPLGIAFGLFFGKQAGVFLLTVLAVRLGFATLPQQTSWLQVYGLACLTGIGFTMSLFIGTLAFEDAAVMNSVRLAVMLGSVAAGLAGYTILRMSSAQARPRDVPFTSSTSKGVSL